MMCLIIFCGFAALLDAVIGEICSGFNSSDQTGKL